MVTVAKSFDAPIKVIWPKDIFALLPHGLLKVPEGTQFSLLGLGDIVLPGMSLFFL
jgi:minor histocompatibility antigen H13